MDPLAHKVARRFLAERLVNKEEVRKRIEAIPGWQRSNFLQSLYRQAERFPLSDKQLAILDKIEKEQAAKPKPAGSHADVQLNPRKQWMENADRDNIVRTLVKKPSITIYDPRGIIAPNQKLHEWFVHELASGFWGAAENYAEMNADEEDGARIQHNSDMRHRNEQAGHDMENAKIHVKQDGPITTITVTPSYQEVVRKHRLER